MGEVLVYRTGGNSKLLTYMITVYECHKVGKYYASHVDRKSGLLSQLQISLEVQNFPVYIKFFKSHSTATREPDFSSFSAFSSALGFKLLLVLPSKACTWSIYVIGTAYFLL